MSRPRKDSETQIEDLFFDADIDTQVRRRTGTTAEWFDGFDGGFKGDFLPWYLAVWGEGSAA